MTARQQDCKTIKPSQGEPGRTFLNWVPDIEQPADHLKIDKFSFRLQEIREDFITYLHFV